ncbi:MAG: ABC transporter permease [Acidimicrobiales bacterium]|nr:ABC transporter permease [Acidimicrobiales bacterium]
MTAPAAGASLHPVRQAVALARRSVQGTLRQPALIAPAFVFPLFFAALSSASFGKTTQLAGFPEVSSFLDFLLPATVVQGVMFGSVQAGADQAVDIQDGFFERLISSPVSRVSILVGRLAGAAVLGAVQAAVFIVILGIFGARVSSGVPGVLVLLLTASLVALGLGGLMVTFAIRTGSAEAVQAAFPLVFALLFLSSAFFPVDLMTGWYATLASWNPVTWMIDGARALVISGFSWSDAATALAVPLAIAVVTVSLAALALRRRLAAA